MKRLLILLCIFLICGCQKSLEINGKITEIKYNDVLIAESDFESIEKLINKSYDKNEEKDLANKLTIKTNKDIYYFSLSDDEIKYSGKVAKNTELNNYLRDLTDKYTNMNFYTIDYMKNYEANSDEKSILLDKTSNYIIINFGKKVMNFKINEIEEENGKFSDIDLLYSMDSVNEGKVIIRKSIDMSIPDIRISFENEYGYSISIIPIYDDGKVQFETTSTAK